MNNRVGKRAQFAASEPFFPISSNSQAAVYSIIGGTVLGTHCKLSIGAFRERRLGDDRNQRAGKEHFWLSENG